MTDRELLELAAKAAGIEHGADRFDSGISLTLPDGRHKSMPKWNPLTDDGDALRLAVVLKLNVKMNESNCRVRWRRHFDGVMEPHGTDPYAATRRAIVRAAAEIGRKCD